MEDWKSLTTEEKHAARAGRGEHELSTVQNNCLKSVLGLLYGHADATNRAWKIAWGNYLINPPEDIAAYLLNSTN